MTIGFHPHIYVARWRMRKYSYLVYAFIAVQRAEALFSSSYPFPYYYYYY